MQFTSVKSSQIKGVGYDEINETIHIMFKHKNKTFLYHPFTLDQYNDFLNAESVGKHFHAFIKKIVIIEDDVEVCVRCEDEFYVELMHNTPIGEEDMRFCVTCYQILNN